MIQIQLGGFTPLECRDKWILITKTITRYRILDEVIEDVELHIDKMFHVKETEQEIVENQADKQVEDGEKPVGDKQVEEEVGGFRDFMSKFA